MYHLIGLIDAQIVHIRPLSLQMIVGALTSAMPMGASFEITYLREFPSIRTDLSLVMDWCTLVVQDMNQKTRISQFSKGTRGLLLRMEVRPRSVFSMLMDTLAL